MSNFLNKRVQRRSSHHPDRALQYTINHDCAKSKYQPMHYNLQCQLGFEYFVLPHLRFIAIIPEEKSKVNDVLSPAGMILK